MIVAEPGREQEAAMRLGRIGFDNVAGYLEDGMQALDLRPDLVARIERITAATLAEQLGGPEPPIVLDVRTENEWREGRLEGSLNIPLARPRAGPGRRPLVVPPLVSGLVREPLVLSLDDLRRFERVTVAVALTCAGNRRNELTKIAPIPGQVPWGAGAVGNALWSGVRLRDILLAAGLEAETSLPRTTSRPVPTGSFRPVSGARPGRTSAVSRSGSCRARDRRRRRQRRGGQAGRPGRGR